jgi:hypothetical protein
MGRDHEDQAQIDGDSPGGIGSGEDLNHMEPSLHQNPGDGVPPHSDW